jgi:phosphorylcholine metabolism protein LicD
MLSLFYYKQYIYEEETTTEHFIFSNKDIELSPKLSTQDIYNIKKSQEKMLGMMKIFHNICVTNNIRYILGYGNLLGAIMYEGWIPWDGDVDIMVDEDDYEKLRNILINELPDGLWFQDHINDKKYPKYTNISKIRELNSCYTSCNHYKHHDGLQIDLTKYTFKNNKMITYDLNWMTKINYDDVYPLKFYKYEDTHFYIPNNYYKFLDRKYGKKWNIILPINKRYPHEGMMDPYNTCKHHKELYPELYPS